MKANKLICLKAAFCTAAVLAGTGLYGCGMKAGEAQTRVSIAKDGSINAHIEESFDKSYYDKEELQQKILTEAADYNRASGSGNISVEKVAVKQGTALVEMSYAGASDYAAFNAGIFFVGTPQEAQDAGYDLDTVLSGAKDDSETVGKADILAMSDYTILITDMKEPVALDGKAAYVSGNVTVGKGLKSVSFDEESHELAYVLYK